MLKIGESFEMEIEIGESFVMKIVESFVLKSSASFVPKKWRVSCCKIAGVSC